MVPDAVLLPSRTALRRPAAVARARLPADELEAENLLDRQVVPCVRGDQVGAEAAGRECDQDVEMDLVKMVPDTILPRSGTGPHRLVR